jgi:hypothetical protein
MHTQEFQANRMMEVATRFKIQPVELSITCMKRLRAHPRVLTRASQLASWIRGYRVSHVTWNQPRQHAAAAALLGCELVTAQNIAVASYYVSLELSGTCCINLYVVYRSRTQKFPTDNFSHHSNKPNYISQLIYNIT